MTYREIKADLFDYAIKITDKSEYSHTKRIPVHCISADFAMSGGIAVPMAKNYSLRQALKPYCYTEAPDCIFVNKVMNLITKQCVYDLPTYKDLTKSLEICKILCDENQIKYLVMPKIGCGIDRLEWSTVSTIIKNVFKDTDIDILVCYL